MIEVVFVVYRYSSSSSSRECRERKGGASKEEERQLVLNKEGESTVSYCIV